MWKCSLCPSRRGEESFLGFFSFHFHFWSGFCKFAMDWSEERGGGWWNIFDLDGVESSICNYQ